MCSVLLSDGPEAAMLCAYAENSRLANSGHTPCSPHMWQRLSGYRLEVGRQERRHALLGSTRGGCGTSRSKCANIRLTRSNNSPHQSFSYVSKPRFRQCERFNIYRYLDYVADQRTNLQRHGRTDFRSGTRRTECSTKRQHSFGARRLDCFRAKFDDNFFPAPRRGARCALDYCKRRWQQRPGFETKRSSYFSRSTDHYTSQEEVISRPAGNAVRVARTSRRNVTGRTTWLSSSEP